MTLQPHTHAHARQNHSSYSHTSGVLEPTSPKTARMLIKTVEPFDEIEAATEQPRWQNAGEREVEDDLHEWFLSA